MYKHERTCNPGKSESGRLLSWKPQSQEVPYALLEVSLLLACMRSSVWPRILCRFYSTPPNQPGIKAKVQASLKQDHDASLIRNIALVAHIGHLCVQICFGWLC